MTYTFICFTNGDLHVQQLLWKQSNEHGKPVVGALNPTLTNFLEPQNYSNYVLHILLNGMLFFHVIKSRGLVGRLANCRIGRVV